MSLDQGRHLLVETGWILVAAKHLRRLFLGEKRLEDPGLTEADQENGGGHEGGPDHDPFVEVFGPFPPLKRTWKRIAYGIINMYLENNVELRTLPVGNRIKYSSSPGPPSGDGGSDSR